MIVTKKPFKEAQYMAVMALAGGTRRVSATAFWESAMLLLREAYGK